MICIANSVTGVVVWFLLGKGGLGRLMLGFFQSLGLAEMFNIGTQNEFRVRLSVWLLSYRGVGLMPADIRPKMLDISKNAAL